MKRYFINFFAVLLVVISFTACNSDDNDDEEDGVRNAYAFYEPVMDWNNTEVDVRKVMKAMVEWKEDVDSEDEDDIVYIINRKTGAEMRYEFLRGTLHSSAVYYYNCSKDFDRMMTDWSNALNLTWKKYDGLPTTYYEAKCSAKACNVSVQKDSNCGMEYMIVEFTHTEFPD